METYIAMMLIFSGFHMTLTFFKRIFISPATSNRDFSGGQNCQNGLDGHKDCHESEEKGWICVRLASCRIRCGWLPGLENIQKTIENGQFVDEFSH